MRIAIAAALLGGTLAAATAVEARCIDCPEGFTFWHSSETCVADDGSGATAKPLEDGHHKPSTSGTEKG